MDLMSLIWRGPIIGPHVYPKGALLIEKEVRE